MSRGSSIIYNIGRKFKMNIKYALKLGQQKLKDKNISSAILDAEVLLARSFSNKNINRAWLYINLNKELNKTVYNKYICLIKRREKYEPIAYITGYKEFYGLNFYVNKNVLIPRPETELLVEEVLKNFLKTYKLKPKNYTIAEIGTGSGCIIVALATKFKVQSSKLKMYGIDISEETLKVAQRNARKHKVDKKIKFLKGNLLNPIPEKMDLMIANLPYVSENEMKKLPADIKNFEPEIALYGGPDGLNYYRKLLKQVDNYLVPCGKIFLEIGYKQASLLKRLIKQNLPGSKIKIIKDYVHHNRIIKIET